MFTMFDLNMSDRSVFTSVSYLRRLFWLKLLRHAWLCRCFQHIWSVSGRASVNPQIAAACDVPSRPPTPHKNSPLINLLVKDLIWHVFLFCVWKFVCSFIGWCAFSSCYECGLLFHVCLGFHIYVVEFPCVRADSQSVAITVYKSSFK